MKQKPTDYRNRIKALEYVNSADLAAHPGNWRDHPAAQAEALKGVLSEVGIAGALLAYRSERQGGALVVIDGHLRKDVAPQRLGVRMKQRRRYDDEFRASAVLMLEAAGYPAKEGALSQVAGHLKVPLSTLRGWFIGTRNPPPAKLRNEKRFDLRQAIRDELAGIFPTMAERRQDATYRELATAAGILIDKDQLLDGKPTWRGEVIDLLRRGTISPADVINELGDDLATELFDAAGVARATGREANG